MPEQWIPKAGPTEKECSKKMFEDWWSKHYSIWSDHWDAADQDYIKRIAFNAWEHQREFMRQLVLDIIKEVEKGI